MTCREKFRKLNPDWTEEEINRFIEDDCPNNVSGMGVDEPDYCSPFTEKCEKCWDREVPDCEIKTNKEENTMVVASNIKKTKAELQEEINALQKEIKNLERYKAYEDMADEMGAMRQAFINSGFSRDEAFKMVMEVMKAGMTIAFKH